jgi:two-component system CheB/CheR fusion protein
MARELFELSSSDLGRPLKDLEMSYRPAELWRPINDAMKERRSMHVPDVKLPSGASVQHLDVHVAPLFDAADEVAGISVTFSDETRRVLLYEELTRSREELETTYEELQASSEELETTSEELQSTNEELETTNEELQSANEELETMNEELQSANEELSAINNRLRERGEEVKLANRFLESVLSSFQQATIVMDRDLRVLLWNEIAQEVWGLRSDEAVGQFFLNLDIGLPVEGLKRPLRAVLTGKSEELAQELDAVNRRGKPFHCRVRIRPLIGEDHKNDGVLVLVEDAR